MKKLIVISLSVLMLTACSNSNKVLNTQKLTTLLDSVLEHNYTEIEPGAMLLVAVGRIAKVRRKR